jgi:protein-L-isoaspartate(D-aspartate) O-methyltransferase
MRMVAEQIAARGVRDGRVLRAMADVPREHFLPPAQREFAYADTPLGIGKGQTISQPYIVALMAEALELKGGERVLEIGTGSGYAAAVLGKLAREVFTIERHGELAEEAARCLAEAGCANVEVLEGDGTLGLAARAPFDGIVVTAGGPAVPPALREQLAIGGRLVIPVGSGRALQTLVRTRRISETRYEREELLSVRFVPLVGAAGWRPENGRHVGPATSVASGSHGVPRLLRECGEPFQSTSDPVVLDALIDRVGDARVVLIGEATHGTSEFYSFRAALTRRLLERRRFSIVAIEADWPDGALVNRWVRGWIDGQPLEREAFDRFPRWMWRNEETRAFVDWLRGFNRDRDMDAQAAVYGLDLYSMFSSIRAVLDFLDRVDPTAARVARLRYGCLTPWEGQPETYARAALTGRYGVCEREAVAMLQELAARRLDYAAQDGFRFLNAMENARLVVAAERYYRAMYYGTTESWNLRDTHMFETLNRLIEHHGDETRAIVWAHNSHLGNAAATEMAARGQTNLGQLCREHFGRACFAVGFGTDHGTVAAAHEWDGEMERMEIRPAHPLSYERLFHDSGHPACVLALRQPRHSDVRAELSAPRLERAIGVVYRPATELQSHYFHAILPEQFDEYVWVDSTTAVTPISAHAAVSLPRAHPFAWGR